MNNFVQYIQKFRQIFDNILGKKNSRFKKERKPQQPYSQERTINRFTFPTKIQVLPFFSVEFYQNSKKPFLSVCTYLPGRRKKAIFCRSLATLTPELLGNRKEKYNISSPHLTVKPTDVTGEESKGKMDL